MFSYHLPYTSAALLFPCTDTTPTRSRMRRERVASTSSASSGASRSPPVFLDRRVNLTTVGFSAAHQQLPLEVEQELGGKALFHAAERRIPVSPLIMSSFCRHRREEFTNSPCRTLGALSRRSIHATRVRADTRMLYVAQLFSRSSGR